MPALDGLRILDMTQYEAVRFRFRRWSCSPAPHPPCPRLIVARRWRIGAQGTSCTQALAWLGADVVKLESPAGDPGRGRDPEQDAEYYIQWNSNKRSIALDLRSEEGKALLFRMLPEYDVFVENYGPNRMEKLGIGYDEMKKHNPSIIYARIKGFGTFLY